MTLKDLYTWLQPRFSQPEAIRLGSLDSRFPRFLALYEAQPDTAPARICLGGAEATHWDVFPVRLVLRWGRSQPEAEAEARRLWNLFYGQTGLTMGSCLVFWTDPGAGPRALGKGGDGVFEYEILVRLYYRK